MKYLLRLVSLIFLISLLPDCSTFNARNAQSSLIIIQFTLQKDELLLDEFLDPRFQKVTLQKGDQTFEYNENSENYYYFQNLKEGGYEIADAVHLLNRGATDFAFGSTKQPPKIDIDFDRKLIETSRVNLDPATIVFMGTFNVRVNFKFQEENQVIVRFSKTPEEEKAALEHLYKNFPRSSWGQKAKAKLKGGF